MLGGATLRHRPSSQVIEAFCSVSYDYGRKQLAMMNYPSNPNVCSVLPHKLQRLEDLRSKTEISSKE